MNPSAKSFAYSLVLLLGISYFTNLLYSQPRAISARPDELVSQLLQDDGNAVFSCSEVVRRQKIAEDLVSLGATALQSIENLVGDDPRLKLGNPVGGAFIYSIYAEIVDRKALDKLMAPRSNNEFVRSQRSWNRAVSIALGLTSYVSDSLPAMREIHCLRGSQPRDTLDRFILGFLAGNSDWFQDSLTLESKKSFSRQIGRDRLPLLTEKLIKKSKRTLSVGYKFAGDSLWTQSETILAKSLNSKDVGAEIEFFRAGPKIQVQFSDASGHHCGSEVVEFQSIRSYSPGELQFRLAVSNFDELLQRIAYCANL